MKNKKMEKVLIDNKKTRGYTLRHRTTDCANQKEVCRKKKIL